jgi:uncharacterized protein (TIGR00255 family)
VSYELSPEQALDRIRIEPEAVAQLAEQLRDVARRSGMADELRLADVLAIPGVVVCEEQTAPLELLGRLATEAIREALTNLVCARRREGGVLREDLLARCAVLERIATDIEARKDEALCHYRQRLQERIGLLGIELAFDDERLAKEVAFAAQKCDITEETVRLRAHLQQFHDLVEKGGEEIGRHLQFLCQELQREINTLNAKTSETGIANLGISFKTELERVREQICNVE